MPACGRLGICIVPLKVVKYWPLAEGFHSMKYQVAARAEGREEARLRRPRADVNFMVTELDLREEKFDDLNKW